MTHGSPIPTVILLLSFFTVLARPLLGSHRGPSQSPFVRDLCLDRRDNDLLVLGTLVRCVPSDHEPICRHLCVDVQRFLHGRSGLESARRILGVGGRPWRDDVPPPTAPGMQELVLLREMSNWGRLRCDDGVVRPVFSISERLPVDPLEASAAADGLLEALRWHDEGMGWEAVTVRFTMKHVDGPVAAFREDLRRSLTGFSLGGLFSPEQGVELVRRLKHWSWADRIQFQEKLVMTDSLSPFVLLETLVTETDLDAVLGVGSAYPILGAYLLPEEIAPYFDHPQCGRHLALASASEGSRSNVPPRPLPPGTRARAVLRWALERDKDLEEDDGGSHPWSFVLQESAYFLVGDAEARQLIEEKLQAGKQPGARPLLEKLLTIINGSPEPGPSPE